MPTPADSTSCEVFGVGALQLCVGHLRLSAEHETPQFGHVHDTVTLRVAPTAVWERLPAKQLGQEKDEKTSTMTGAPFAPKK